MFESKDNINVAPEELNSIYPAAYFLYAPEIHEIWDPDTQHALNLL